MKKALWLVLLLPALITLAKDPVKSEIDSSPKNSSSGEADRFQACENFGGSGFFWIDTGSGDLWRLTPPAMEWLFLGAPHGATAGPWGAYKLLPDRTGGVFILNTYNGQGWWTDGTDWKIIGEPSRRVKRVKEVPPESSDS